MKFKELREHYVTKDGVNWTPKTAYETEQEIRDQGFHPNKFIVYPCSQCGKFHISGIRKKND
jgi:hypothetical protein